MKILWVTNKEIPHVLRARGKEVSLVNEGWLSQVFDQLRTAEGIDLSIACGGATEDCSGTGDGFSWISFREGRYEENFYSKEVENVFIGILKRKKYDVIHVWGTEYPHTLALINAAIACGCIDKVVVSIQGLISMCALAYQCALPDAVYQRKTLLEMVRKTGMSDVAQAFVRRGQYEIEALSKVRHCIGRTEWDYCCVKAFSRDISYHFCNETLRECFYTGDWDYGNCKKHSILVSQATYPLKGFHLLLNALPKVIEAYPDAHVYVTGADQTTSKTLIERLKLSSYGKYLRELIEKNRLQEHVSFVGRKKAEQMKELYLQANVFVSCSSIENSPNSVGEAMLLGTPVVASDVGGTSTVLHGPEEGLLYRWNDTDELAEAILDVFGCEADAGERTRLAREHARRTHDVQENFRVLMEIYREISAAENA